MTRTNQPNLRGIELEALRAYYQDGLMELLMGVLLLFAGGLFYVGSQLVIFVVLWIFLMKPVWEWLKQRITYPRIGYVNFPVDPEAGKGILKALLIFFLVMAVILVGLSLLLGSERGLDLWLQRVIPALVGVLLACGPIYAAQTYGLKHWYGLAALFVVSGLVVPFLADGSVYTKIAIQISIVGIVSLLIGLGLLVNFIRTHPVLETEDANVNG